MRTNKELTDLPNLIKLWGREFGFADVRIADVNLSQAEKALNAWLEQGCHGEMTYMVAHSTKRSRPDELVPGAVRAITVRMDYLSQETGEDWKEYEALRQKELLAARISLYARGRDYHKVLRKRLQQFASRIEQEVGSFGYRVFVDSGPVMEVALAEKAGLGWRGKNNLLLHQQGGSLFFLGEILTDLPLPTDSPVGSHCGRCQKCMTSCPTTAITAPYFVDARRCISYLTIELKGSIPIELRPLIGNRIYGCDDCQLCCPWNKYAQSARVPDFGVRHDLDSVSLVELFEWDENAFNQKLQGSPIRRIGYERWLRNIAVSLGNAGRDTTCVEECRMIAKVLQSRMTHTSLLVQEHIAWALSQFTRSQDQTIEW